ncbi:hypothetical protein LCGC14_0562820 [marine sediment metagenome]|uniref:Uncharacterized protein n=1 Tax=marine sediment metagenome TaxID=412755 RepID=A0A0F9U7Z5_9ZZZZ
MAIIKSNFGEGLAGITPQGSGTPTLATAMRDVADDFETMRATNNAVNAKLDADAGITDTDYAALHDIASATIKTKKG